MHKSRIRIRHLFIFLFLEILFIPFLLRGFLQRKQIQVFQSRISSRSFNPVPSSIPKSSTSLSPKVLCPCLVTKQQNGSYSKFLCILIF